MYNIGDKFICKNEFLVLTSGIIANYKDPTNIPVNIGNMFFIYKYFNRRLQSYTSYYIKSIDLSKYVYIKDTDLDKYFENITERRIRIINEIS